MKLSRSYSLPFPRALVAALLRDPAFNVERELLREGVISSEFRTSHNTDRDSLFELHTVEHKRTMTGALDRNSTVHTRTSFRYDASAGTVSWQYSGEAGKLVELKGIYTLNPRENTTDLTHEVTISVWIPMMGPFVEQHIARQFERSDGDYLELMHKHLARLDE